MYLVDKISFYDFTVIAKETDLTVGDVLAEEVFDISDFRDFKVTLRNGQGIAEIINLEKWKKRCEIGK